MSAVKTRNDWANFLKFYSGQNLGRRTRLGIFENAGDTVDDYWIENGAQLNGIDTDLSSSTPAIEIMLEGYTHVTTNPRSLKIYYSQDGGEDGLDLCDSEGRTTVLRFEGRE